MSRTFFLSVSSLALLVVACGGSSEDDALFTPAGTSGSGGGTAGKAGTSASAGKASAGTSSGGASSGGTSSGGTSSGGASGSSTAGTGGMATAGAGGNAGTGGGPIAGNAGSTAAGMGGAGAGKGGAAGVGGGPIAGQGGASGAGTGGNTGGAAGSPIAGQGGATGGTAGANMGGMPMGGMNMGGKGGSPNLCANKDCSALNTACSLGVCNPTTGACTAQPLPVGTLCDDGNPCTTGDACGGGLCAGVQKDCSSLDEVCLVGICNPTTGQCLAANQPDKTPCNDGNPSTSEDACDKGVCVGKTSRALRLDEISIDLDYVRLKNVGTSDLNLKDYVLFIDNSTEAGANEPSYTVPLPDRVLGAGEFVDVLEMGLNSAPGDIVTAKNFFFTNLGGGAWLCAGACSSSTIVDAVMVGSTKNALPAPVTFTTALTSTSTMAAWKRAAAVGTNPTFLSSDWQVSAPSRTNL